MRDELANRRAEKVAIVAGIPGLIARHRYNLEPAVRLYVETMTAAAADAALKARAGYSDTLVADYAVVAQALTEAVTTVREAWDSIQAEADQALAILRDHDVRLVVS